jgi:Holliday junction resolvase RusA-like endonuclease
VQLHPRGLLAWRAAVRAAAATAMGATPPLTGPVLLAVHFGLLRPRSQVGARGQLRRRAPRFPATRPDLDKLIRAIGDALTGVVWHDDGQVVAVVAAKGWTVPARTQLVVVPLEAPERGSA